MQPEQQPQDNVELEALAQLGIQGNESLSSLEVSNEAAVLKLDDIEKNTEAQIVQSMKSTEEMISAIKPSLEAQAKMANIFSSLMTNLEGPPGKTPEKGVDYFTDSEVAEFLNKATPRKGKDYFTAEDVAEFRKMVTPQKGVDYRDGEDGALGADGRNPLTASRKAPSNPQIGDLWYQI